MNKSRKHTLEGKVLILCRTIHGTATTKTWQKVDEDILLLPFFLQRRGSCVAAATEGCHWG